MLANPCRADPFTVESGRRQRGLCILNASGWRYRPSHMAAAIRIDRAVRLLEVPLVTGAPTLRGLLACFFSWKARLDRASARFGGDESPTQQCQSRYAMSLHVCGLTDAAVKMKTPSPGIAYSPSGCFSSNTPKSAIPPFM
jgi:hypothetical protein